jgi:hypothetical protein
VRGELVEVKAGRWKWLRVRGVGVRGCSRLLCIGSRHTTNGISLSCVETNIHDKASLPCAGARQTFFLQFFEIHKNCQINLTKFNKLDTN